MRDRPLEWIWRNDPAFGRFRGTTRMSVPCRGCSSEGKELGGRRCQALALTGGVAATDPACEFSPCRREVAALVATDSAAAGLRHIYRH